MLINYLLSPFILRTVNDGPVRVAGRDEVWPGHRRERLHHQVDANIPGETQEKSENSLSGGQKTLSHILVLT